MVRLPNWAPGALTQLIRGLWALFLVTLPVTSFPYLPPAIGGDALVRPLSLYPLALLIPLAILPRLWRERLPKTILPLFVLGLVSIASLLIALVRNEHSAFEISVVERGLRGLMTLLIGYAFYLTTALLPNSVEDLRFSLRWIFTGCGLAMLWGSVQAIYIVHFDANFFAVLTHLQSFVSTRRLLIERISGLTYEPHWFADQLVLLVLPAALAAVLVRYSIFHQRKSRLSLEWLFLGWVVLLLPFTFSRAGLLNLIVTVLGSVSLYYFIKQAKLSAKRSNSWLSSARKIVLVLIVALLIITPVYAIGQKNEFFARIWRYWQQPDQSILGYLTHLGFDTRLAYNQAAYYTFQSHPLLGVGLSNFGLTVQEMLPMRPMTVEVLRATSPDTAGARIATPKNLFLKLLAETGVFGLAAFLAFVIAILGSAVYLIFSPEPHWKYWGISSLIGVGAGLVSALTFDSLVIPNLWIVFGMTTAAWRVHQIQTGGTSSP
jgi:O-antigen ligase